MEIEIIKHRDLLFKDLLRIIRLKTTAWPYPLGSQVEWIANNISDNDEHVFLRDKNIDVAYLNLVKTSFIANNVEYVAFGIGNVCASVKGKGYGRELMEQVSNYLFNHHYCGLLFCRQMLVPFYQRCGWHLIEPDICLIPSLSEGIFVMSLYAPNDIIEFEYKGKLF